MSTIRLDRAYPSLETSVSNKFIDEYISLIDSYRKNISNLITDLNDYFDEELERLDFIVLVINDNNIN